MFPLYVSRSSGLLLEFSSMLRRWRENRVTWDILRQKSLFWVWLESLSNRDEKQDKKEADKWESITVGSCFWITDRQRLNNPFTGLQVKSAWDDELPLSSIKMLLGFVGWETSNSVLISLIQSPSFFLPLIFPSHSSRIQWMPSSCL